jgi:uncharacterized membrane protein YcaP (DUF421 family)
LIAHPEEQPFRNGVFLSRRSLVPPETVEPLDVMRMFVGDQDPLFYVEILVRTLIIYGYGLLLLRWLGSRTVGQLSTVEFLLVIALGSAVGDPMFYPDVPILHGLAVVTFVVLANKGLDMLIARSKHAERVIDGRPLQVIENGVLHKARSPAGSMGQSELFQQLRQRGIRHLGEVRHVYMEPDGALSVFRYTDGEVRPGLPIVPPWEITPPVQLRGDGPVGADMTLSCLTCGTTGTVAKEDAPGPCPHCHRDKWTIATIAPPGSEPTTS